MQSLNSVMQVTERSCINASYQTNDRWTLDKTSTDTLTVDIYTHIDSDHRHTDHLDTSISNHQASNSD